MAKNANLDILRRWQAIDYALSRPDGLHIESFAKKISVSTRTVRRDLEVFEAVGHPPEHKLDADGVRHIWQYQYLGDRMFACNLPPRPEKKGAGSYSLVGVRAPAKRTAWNEVSPTARACWALQQVRRRETCFFAWGCRLPPLLPISQQCW